MILQKNKYCLCLLLVVFAACTGKMYKPVAAERPRLQALPVQNPVLKRLARNPLQLVKISVPDANAEASYEKIAGSLNAGGLKQIEKLEVYLAQGKPVLAEAKKIGELMLRDKDFEIPVSLQLKPGVAYVWITAALKDDADVDGTVQLKTLLFGDVQGKWQQAEGLKPMARRTGIALRQPGDDGVNSYRIPGMVTTDKGTLIAVYDIRYKNSGDLPGNIDVGLSRSRDGGKTWEPMKIIMDMGAPHENNGVGDPAVLFDPVTKKIWVVALWSKGNRSIAGSGPGFSADETGQFAVVSSSDDGLNWTAPNSLTPQVKREEWRLFFNGPGNGIAMADGKIVFAAQYWDAHKMPHSTLIYSADHGKTWKSGIGAKSNTTESQLVETVPGTLMLNMRDNRGRFRSVATTTDMGNSWLAHPTSYRDLADPVCMGSLIKARVKVKGKLREVLFFSNPNVSEAPRRNLTIKASMDMGETWQQANQLLLDERPSFGYSVMTKIDDETIGILYEGIRDLYFVRVPVKEIIK